jgi:general secretion pathway protein G
MRTFPAGSRGHNRGVTLLELLAVLAAVLVLSAIAVPSFNAYVERTRVTRVVGEIGAMNLSLYRWQLNTRTFPATLAEAGLGGNDPWGNPYQYTRVQGTPDNELRKDHNLHPINTDFDLYSMGADGETRKPLTAQKSRDDIVRANNGAFIGLAKDY